MNGLKYATRARNSGIAFSLRDADGTLLDAAIELTNDFTSSSGGPKVQYFGGLPVGPFEVCASSPDRSAKAPYGYAPLCPTVTGTANQMQPLSLVLPHGGALSGTVTRAGAPWPNWPLTVRLPDGTPVNLGVQTDMNGHFEVDQLPAGEYVVCADGEVNRWSPTYYGETTSRTTATLVPVSADQLTTGIDIQMLPWGS
jgi:hypothetical protein